MGGSDQWGNIVNGVELGRRIDDRALYGLTTPLITTSAGAKMGKTAAGAVWINADKLTPYDYWQYWRNTEDADVGRFFRLFTDLPVAEIAEIEKVKGASINEAKIRLANEATTLAHGREAAEAAAETARKTFVEGGVGGELPTLDVPRAELAKGIPVYLLFQRAGLTASNGEARRLIKGGGARVNDGAVADDTLVITSKMLSGDGMIKLSAGKKKHALVRAV
jgi:tyrosyl-tRNA synthetase